MPSTFLITSPLAIRSRNVDMIGSPAPTLASSRKYFCRFRKSSMRAAYCRHGNTFARLFGVMMCRFALTKSGYAFTIESAAVQSTTAASVNSSFAISLARTWGSIRLRETDNLSRQRARLMPLPSSANHLLLATPTTVTSNPWESRYARCSCSCRSSVPPIFPTPITTSARRLRTSKKA